MQEWKSFRSVIHTQGNFREADHVSIIHEVKAQENYLYVFFEGFENFVVVNFLLQNNQRLFGTS